MPLKLELPSQLGEELKEEAGKAGVSTEEHATVLLYVASALLRDEQATPPRETVRRAISDQELDAERVAAVLEKLVARLTAWNHSDDLAGPAELPVRTGGHGSAARRSAMGRYAHIPGTSDEFAAEKQDEIDREERKRA